jgi:hypothetical protein
MLRRAPVVAFLMALVVASTAYAGNPNRTSSNSSISLVLMNTAAATTTAAPTSGPQYRDTVTFAVKTDATSQPFVHLKCWQDRTLVLEGWQGFFSTALGNQSFNLGPTPAWSGGSASCTAYLENWDSYSKNGKITTLASTTFDVSG